MPRHAKGVSQGKIDKGRPGRYGDGGGLYLNIESKTSKYWTFRYVRGGRMREMGLGRAIGHNVVSLSDARQEARKLWDIHRAGRDPLAERRAGRVAITAASIGSGRTFKQAAIEFIDLHRGSWRNAVHARQWETTLADDVYPVIGELSVDVITTAHVAAVLTPIWTTKPETASRIRGRIEQVLGRERALGHRSGENPARWKENLAPILPRHSKVKRVKHHVAMPVRELGDFMAKLRADDSVTARAGICDLERRQDGRGARRQMGRDRSRRATLDRVRRAHEGRPRTSRAVGAARDRDPARDAGFSRQRFRLPWPPRGCGTAGRRPAGEAAADGRRRRHRARIPQRVPRLGQ